MSSPTLPVGFHKLAAAAYHADPAEKPSLSSSIGNVMLTRSPYHAWWRHPRLNPAWKPTEPAANMDFGSAVHALFLEQYPKRIAEIPCDNFKTNVAKEQRELARKNDLIPLLTKDLIEATRMAEAALEQIRGTELHELFVREGDAEIAAIWSEDRDRIYCRSLLDWCSTDRHLVVDYKTRNASAEPNTFIRAMLNEGYDLQCSMYRRGVKALTGKDPKFVFVVQETDEPYCLSMVGLKPEWLAFADHKINRAVEVWGKCMAEDKWPAYPRRVCWVDAPPWAETLFMQQELGGTE